MRKSPQKAKKGQAAAASASGAMKGFSKGERDLYREVNQIKSQRQADETAELERTKAYF